MPRPPIFAEHQLVSEVHESCCEGRDTFQSSLAQLPAQAPS